MYENPSRPTTSAHMTAFSSALPDLDPNSLCSPPGLGGLWRVRWIVEGINQGVIVEHWSKMGYAFRIPREHGCCHDCAVNKRACEHCSCKLCAWEHRAEERSSPRCDPAKVHALVLRLQAFRMGAPKVPVGLLDD